MGPGMDITVGHIVDNPTFDTCFEYRIVTAEPDGSWRDLYNSREADDDPPVELLAQNVTYLTLGDNTLILEIRY